MYRPAPRASLLDLVELPELGIRLTPAPDVWEWIRTHILADTGSIHNEDHAHLLDADIQVMWASTALTKKGRTVVGQAEQVAFRAGGWQKARMEQQMFDWFGEVPAFIITLAADYCAQCSDADFCALVEHELYHIAHANDKYGQPAFTKDGAPKLQMRGHDVEEFVGVVRRYGASPDVQALVDAANSSAEVGKLNTSRACGRALPGPRWGLMGQGRLVQAWNYYHWLQQQPVAFQYIAIGPVRAKLFREGGLTVERFAELQLDRNFAPLTLVQMKGLEPLAFDRAGV